MKFFAPLTLLALITSVIANPIGFPADGDNSFALAVREAGKSPPVTAGKSSGKGSPGPSGSGSGSGPLIPSGGNPKFLHVWERLDQQPVTYGKSDSDKKKHTGLNNKIIELGGKHVDVIVGNPTAGFNEYGLQWNEKVSVALQNANADGAAISLYNLAYTPVASEKLTYRGVLDGRATQNSVGTKRKLQTSSVNCRHCADEIVLQSLES